MLLEIGLFKKKKKKRKSKLHYVWAIAIPISITKDVICGSNGHIYHNNNNNNNRIAIGRISSQLDLLSKEEAN